MSSSLDVQGGHNLFGAMSADALASGPPCRDSRPVPSPALNLSCPKRLRIASRGSLTAPAMACMRSRRIRVQRDALSELTGSTDGSLPLCLPKGVTRGQTALSVRPHHHVAVVIESFDRR